MRRYLFILVLMSCAKPPTPQPVPEVLSCLGSWTVVRNSDGSVKEDLTRVGFIVRGPAFLGVVNLEVRDGIRLEVLESVSVQKAPGETVNGSISLADDHEHDCKHRHVASSSQYRLYLTEGSERLASCIVPRVSNSVCSQSF